MNVRLWQVMRGVAILLVSTLVCGLSLAPAAAPPSAKRAANGAQDFVFLGEARPVLVRVHARVDGKSVQAAWDDFMKYLFAYLDINADGTLSKDEAQGVPTSALIRSAGLGVGFRGNSGGPALANLDLDRDGKVSRAELAMYYRTHGLQPFQFQLDPVPTSVNAALFTGRGLEPPVEIVSKALFSRLDTDEDGKLTPRELTQAPEILLGQDEDEDEMLTSRELVPDYKPRNNLFGRMAMMSKPGKKGTTPVRTIVPIEYPGVAPPELVRGIQQRYGPSAVKGVQKKLSQKDLGLDDDTFRRLDADGDGVLDGKELAGFVRRTPDVELVVHLGEEDRIESLAGSRSPLAKQVRWADEVALLDLGMTRVELRGGPAEESGFGNLSSLVRVQIQAQFRGADKDNNGYIDSKEVKGNPVFQNLFKTMDRDGDGKLHEKEVVAYLEQYQQIQEKAQMCCVSLVFADHGSGLFSLLDNNRDSRLSVREVRGAVGLLKPLDRTGKGYLTRTDLPHSYQLTIRPGPAGADPLQGVGALYRGYDNSKGEPKATKGPLWFRKMDKNRDGDVSRKEWIFSDAQFRKADTDRDDLISALEAERFDSEMRRQE